MLCFFYIAPASNKTSEKTPTVKPLNNHNVKSRLPKTAPVGHKREVASEEPPDTSRTGATTNRYPRNYWEGTGNLLRLYLQKNWNGRYLMIKDNFLQFSIKTYVVGTF